MKALLFIALCALALMPGNTARAEGSAVPGRSVGHVFLGMDRADVWKILGKPKRSTTVPHGMDLYGEDDWVKGTYPTLTVTSLRDKVVQVEFDSPRITTTEGLSTNSTLAKVRRQHPAMTVRAYLVKGDVLSADQDYAMPYYLDDVGGGIAVTCAPYEGIVRESLRDRLDTIIIHRPGVAAVPVYNGHWAAPGKDPDALAQLRQWFTPHRFIPHKGVPR